MGDDPGAGKPEAREPIPIRRGQAVGSDVSATQPEQPADGPAWSLPALAGLAVWAEDAMTTLGSRRFEFVLELASLADMLSEEARDVLLCLVDREPTTEQDERPLHVNECLVILRQLEAIQHGEKIVRLPRRKGIRHRRIR